MPDIFHGDCLDLLPELAAESVDLIYLDPPFNTGRDFVQFDDRWTGRGGDTSALGDVWLRQHIETAAETHSDGMAGYLLFMTVRIVELHRVLKPTGSLYLHCDPTASHYLKVVLDRIFGAGNFRNEIVWAYFGPSATKRDFPRKHDTIFRYVKSDRFTFNADAVRVPYKALGVQGAGKGKGCKGIGGGLNSSNIENYRKKGKIPASWWDDFHTVGVGRSKAEKTGYPTQKPLALLRRIIESSSNEGDLVLDPFCGSGTTGVAALELGRRFIGMDINPEAVELARARLAQ